MQAPKTLPFSIVSIMMAMTCATCSGIARADDRGEPDVQVPVLDIQALLQAAQPMPFPELKTSDGPPTSRGRMVSKDLRTGEVLEEDIVDVDTFVERSMPGSDPSLFKGDDGSYDFETQNFSGWNFVSNPSSGDYPKQVKLVMTFTDNNNVVRTASCSGTLIDPMHVITAGHCLYVHGSINPLYSVFDWVDSVIVTPGYFNGNPGQWGTAQGVQLHSWSGWTEDEDSNHDMGIIDLDRPLGSMVGWRGYGYQDDASFWTEGIWSHAGYPAESPFNGNFMYENTGTFDDVLPFTNLARFYAPSWGGSSGSGAVRQGTVWGVLIQSDRQTNTIDNRMTSTKFADINYIIDIDRPNTYDLWPVQFISSDSFVNIGDSINAVSFRIHNYSEASYSGPVNYGIYLSDNNTISTDDLLLGSYSVNVSLAPNATYIVSMPGPTIPLSATAGPKSIGVVITNNDANPSNNDSAPQDQDTVAITCGSPIVPPTFTPADGATCQPTNPQLHWNLVANAVGYDVQVGSTCGSGPIYAVTGQVDVFNIANLLPGATYYWRVRSKVECGSASAWSECKSFTVASSVGTVTFNGPPDGFQCQPATAATIDWQDYPGAQGYEIRLSTSCGAPVVPVFKTWSDHTFTLLNENTTYYYQVRVQGPCGNWGSWSTCRSFTTLPASLATPSSVYPPEGFSCMGTAAGLSWNAVTGATGYEVELGTACGEGTVYTPSTNVLNLTLPEGTYVWRVRSVHVCGDASPWSPCHTFSVDGTPPSQPAFMVSPSHQIGVWSSDNNVVVRFDKSTDSQCGVEYMLFWDNQPNTIPTQYFYGVSDPQTTIQLPDGENYVHMIAKDGAGNFVNDVVHLGPFLIDTTAPANPTTITPDAPVNQWIAVDTIAVSWGNGFDAGSGVAGYDFVWDQMAGGSPAMTQATSEQSSVLNSPPDGMHFLHLATEDNVDLWSGVATVGPFLVDSTPPISTLQQPSGGDTVMQGAPITIEWHVHDATSDVASIQAWYSGDQGRNWTPIGTYDGSLHGTEWFVPFIQSQELLLKVVGIDNAGNESEDRTDADNPIHVNLVTAADPIASAEVFGLADNFPNPFNPQTRISYSLADEVGVSLRVFDVKGRLVRTLVAERQPKGEHSVVWDGTNDRGQGVASGIYLYQMRAGDFVQSKRMTLLK